MTLLQKSLLAAFCAFSLGACSSLDAINPFSSSGPKMAKLEPISETMKARVAFRENLGKAGDAVFMPAVGSRTIVAASKNGEIVVLDNGTARSRFKAEQALSAGVGADRDLIVVGTQKAQVLAFDAQTGASKWTAKASSEVLAPPVVAGGFVFVRSGDHRITAYDANSGEQKWIFQRPLPALSLRATAPFFVDGGFAIVGFPGGKLIALNAANGVPVWEGSVAYPKGATEIERVADITSLPVADQGTLCAVAFQGKVTCFDTRGGSTLWSRDMSSSSGLVMDERAVYVSDEKGAIHALDRSTGSSLWKQDKLFLRQLSAPALLKGRVVVGDVEGVLHFIDRNTGAFVGRLTTDGSAIVAPLQVAGDRLILQTQGGSVMGVEIE